MSEVKRYDFRQCVSGMYMLNAGFKNTGDYVSFDDYSKLEQALSRTKAELEEAKKLLNSVVFGVDYFHRTYGSMRKLLKAYSESREFLSNQTKESSEE